MPRLASLVTKLTSVGSKKTPVFIKNYTGTDFSAVHSTWTFSTGTISLRSTTLPYHSYGNENSITTATNQGCDRTWSLRAGTNTTTSVSAQTSSTGNIGYWINGVNMFNPSAASEAPNGYLKFTNLNYNAAYEAGIDYSFSLDQDTAGGHVISNGNYHYHNFSFAAAWTTGTAHVGTGTKVVTTGSADVSIISYFNGSLTHTNGHSKILGWSLDGYPVYGPYGYNQALDCNSGVRALISGYSVYSSPYDVSERVLDGVLNSTTYPMGIFVQDYYYSSSGDLDEHNGRYCVTPEYPEGTYAYFCTIDSSTGKPAYPYVIGNTHKSTPLQGTQTTSTSTNGGGFAPKQTG